MDYVSINPNGDVNVCCVTIGNIDETDILDSIENYDPYKNEIMKRLLQGGIRDVIKLGKVKGLSWPVFSMIEQRSYSNEFTILKQLFINLETMTC